jgi:hypothetical protein
MRVERDPEPGIEVRLVSLDSDKGDDWAVFSVRPVSETPELYPATIPFVSGTSAIVGVFGETVTVAWSLAEAPACPVVPGMEPDPKLEGLAEQLKSLGEGGQVSSASERAARGERVKAVFDSLDPDTRASLERFMQALQPEAEVLREIERVFESVFQASVADGWRVVERKDAGTAFRALSAELERDNYTRRILLMSMFPGSSVMLLQSERESQTPG